MNTFGRRLSAALIMLLAAALAFSLAGIQSAEAKPIKKITPKVLGVHAYNIEPGVPAGSLRLVCFPTWRDIEKTKGNYDWDQLDAYVNNALSWGYKDILYTFCGTPKWAVGSQTPRYPDRAAVVPGDATAALPPADMGDWKAFVKAVAKRYKGKITSYQAWNEITSFDFYQGTAGKMAQMTKVAYKAIRKVDPKADVISASVQTYRQDRYNAMADPYFAALKKKKWPLTHMSGHFYPATGKAGPNERLKLINLFRNSMKRYRMPKKKEIWDTESNFRVGQSNKATGTPAVSGKKGAEYLARNYLDTWRTGLTRSYWYQWSLDVETFPGVQLRPGDPATAAFATLTGWVKGAKFKKCSKKGKLVACKFKKKGTNFTIAFTEKGKKKYKFSGKKKVCPVYGGSCKTTKRSTKVKTMPVRIG